MNEQDGVTPQIDVHGQAVEFQVTISVPTTFARIAGQESFQVEAHARALASNDTTDYEAIDCSTYTNSTDSWSMCAVGNSLRRSSAFYSAGGVSGETNFNPPPLVDQPPFKIRLPPAAALCH